MSSIRAWWQARYQQWLRRRLPPARSILLEQRRLFIFPSRMGFLFMAMLLLMLVTAINYQNNLSYALTFWLAMLFIVAVHFTHGNLMGLTVTAVSASSVFPGQQTEIQLRLTGSPRRGHSAVRLVWPASETIVDVPAGSSQTVTLFLPTERRGWYVPPRLKIESTYPLGLLRCWTFAQLDLRALVWPRPLVPEVMAVASASDNAGGFSDVTGVDDLAGFRDYRPGDPLRHIDWRAYAREQELQTLVFSAPTRENHWLDWEDYPDTPTEQRLSWLCWRALQHDSRGDDYGLRLPQLDIALASGDRQREQILRALALHGLADLPPETSA